MTQILTITNMVKQKLIFKDNMKDITITARTIQLDRYNVQLDFDFFNLIIKGNNMIYRRKIHLYFLTTIVSITFHAS